MTKREDIDKLSSHVGFAVVFGGLGGVAIFSILNIDGYFYHFAPYGFYFAGAMGSFVGFGYGVTVLLRRGFRNVSGTFTFVLALISFSSIIAAVSLIPGEIISPYLLTKEIRDLSNSHIVSYKIFSKSDPDTVLFEVSEAGQIEKLKKVLGVCGAGAPQGAGEASAMGQLEFSLADGTTREYSWYIRKRTRDVHLDSEPGTGGFVVLPNASNYFQ